MNVLFTIVVYTRNPSRQGIGALYSGKCDTVKWADFMLHLLLNILGTFLLAASNFTMQCLSSPTRSEVDTAHLRKRSLDVGLTSFKNLFLIKRWKALLWVGLCMSTIPLHLLSVHPFERIDLS